MREERPNSALDRALAELRDAPVPDGPRALLEQTTLTKLYAAELRAERARRQLVLRIAAMIVLGVCVAAIVWSLLQRRHDIQVANRAPHPSPAPASVAPHAASPNTDVTPPVAVRHFPEEQSDFEPPGPARAASARPRAAAFASAVTLTGHVYYDGAPPPRRAIDLSACPQCLASLRGPIYDDSMVVNDDGSLQNVVVSISSAPDMAEHFAVPPDPVVLDQKYCTFEPHVIAAMVGQEMVLRNSDRLLHSSHAMDSETTPLFNFALPTVGERRIEPFQTVETFKVKCDLHPWMSAWVRVLPNPYFDVTRGDGTFTIRDLPPGTYRIKAWHELLGVVEKQVTVWGGEPVVVDFTYRAR